MRFSLVFGQIAVTIPVGEIEVFRDLERYRFSRGQIRVRIFLECLNAHFFSDRTDAVLADYFFEETFELFEFFLCCCRLEVDIIGTLVSVKSSYDVDGFVH
jgi:hypothetical protein